MFGGKKLNKTDRKHLREMNIDSKYFFEKQIAFLKEEHEKNPNKPYLCYDCIRIARKLGMWD